VAKTVKQQKRVDPKFQNRPFFLLLNAQSPLLRNHPGPSHVCSDSSEWLNTFHPQ
jgi:hypothetical protein